MICPRWLAGDNVDVPAITMFSCGPASVIGRLLMTSEHGGSVHFAHAARTPYTVVAGGVRR